MQDKRFYPYLFLHAGIVTLWVILDRTHKGIANHQLIVDCRLALLFQSALSSCNDITAKGNNI